MTARSKKEEFTMRHRGRREEKYYRLRGKTKRFFS
jgi:hypothetical protein